MRPVRGPQLALLAEEIVLRQHLPISSAPEKFAAGDGLIRVLILSEQAYQAEGRGVPAVTQGSFTLGADRVHSREFFLLFDLKSDAGDDFISGADPEHGMLQKMTIQVM